MPRLSRFALGTLAALWLAGYGTACRQPDGQWQLVGRG